MVKISKRNFKIIKHHPNIVFYILSISKCNTQSYFIDTYKWFIQNPTRFSGRRPLLHRALIMIFQITITCDISTHD
ncbi:hypothetical protein L1887_38683 [Cichorium endivia]|nr:hypothetical protein L1887_38683 [Cichorium endivia]